MRAVVATHKTMNRELTSGRVMLQKPELGVHMGASRWQSLHASTCLMSSAPDVDNIALEAISTRVNFMKG